MVDKIHYLLTLVAVIAALAAIGLIGQSPAPAVGSAEMLVECPVAQAGGAARPPDSTEAIFSQDHVRTYSLCLVPADWQHLQTHPFEKEYQKAVLFIDGAKIGEVGLRYKGHSSLDRCFEGEVQTCAKASMKIKVNEFQSGFDVQGLTKLNFNGMHGDPSLMREHVASHIFRSMGIPAPRTATARLEINGKDLGLFALVEQIDKSFIKNEFPDSSNGNLYKEAWPTISTTAERALPRLRTNRRAADLTALLNFGQELQESSPVNLPHIVDNRLHREKALRYLAVDRTLQNHDGITALYCEGNICGNHNYYLYEDNTNRFEFLPWDLGGVLGMRFYIEPTPEWNEPTHQCTRRYDNDTRQASNCDAVFRGLASGDQQPYRDALAELALGPLQPSEVEGYIDRLAGVITPHVATDHTGPSTHYWHNAVAALKDELRFSRLRAQALRAGGQTSDGQLSAERSNNWERTSDFAAIVGLRSVSSPGTSFTHQLNTRNPIQGSRDLRLDFTFRNGQEAWSQWGYVAMPFQAGQANLSEFRSLQLTLRSDKPRQVRINLDRKVRDGERKGALYGWVVETGPQSVPVALAFNNLALPEWAEPTSDSKDDTLATATAIRIEPQPVGINTTTGLFPSNTSDTGYLHIDDVIFAR